jgi:putative NADPH-quinone reductase
MPDEQTEKIVKVLEEIRDLLKERNRIILQKSDETAQRYKEAQARFLTHRRRFLWTLGILLVLAMGWVTYVFFWAIPRSDERQMERQMEETRMMQSNYLSQPGP